MLAGLLLILAAPTRAGEERQLKPLQGDPKPPFALADLNDVTQDLRSNASAVVLVHFFATWCEPCREELASLRRLRERMPAEQLSVVAVSVAEVPLRVRSFLETAPVNFPVLLDTNRAVARAWEVSTLPTTFVLDRKLTARHVVEGDVDWQRQDILAALELVAAERSTERKN